MNKFETDDRLQVFLYLLMRDHVVPGIIPEIINKHLETARYFQYGDDCADLMNLARKYADRIRKKNERFPGYSFRGWR
jgi:hypothetical protein